MVTVFAVCAVVGVLALIASLVLGDTDFGGGDVDGGLPWLSAPALAAAVGVFGVVGWPLYAGTAIERPVVVLIAAGAGIGAYALLMVVLRAMRRAQTGTVAGLRAAVGRTATVTMSIPAGGWGQVSYLDAESVRATTTAVLAKGDGTAADGSRVLIVDVDGDRLVVEPLALP
ncbi:NfeD family protein [Tsukamurella sp. 1534]|uniref:NfeD family protein n=1 Tax=Tsukamurella sp. 1534 TaxID=1151061 RepID=UPI00131F148E|nr:NfeD family protein [Tsukamurella sp. 1534]